MHLLFVLQERIFGHAAQLGLLHLQSFYLLHYRLRLVDFALLAKSFRLIREEVDLLMQSFDSKILVGTPRGTFLGFLWDGPHQEGHQFSPMSYVFYCPAAILSSPKTLLLVNN